MDNGNSLSAADVALLSRNNGNDWGLGNGFEGLIYLAVIASMFGNGNGFGWGNNRGFNNAIGYENLATSNEVQRGFDNQNQMANQREILTAVTNGTAQSVAATNSTFHDTLAVLNDKYGELQRDIAGLAVGQANALANQNQCCCDIKQLIQTTSSVTDAAIANLKYEQAMNLAGVEQRLTAKMDANTIQNLRDQVDALRDQVNMSGVLRFPNQWSYGAGPFPPIFGNNPCGNNANNFNI